MVRDTLSSQNASTCYETLCCLNMHPHTKFGIPTSKNKGDMHWTGSGTDGRTDGRRNGQSNYYMPPTVPLGGHKNSFVKKAELMITGNPVCIYKNTSLYSPTS